MRHSFFIYAIIIGTIGSILNNAIEDYNLRFISSGVIDLSAPRSLRLF
ncbi:MscS family inner membrane protein YnaI [Salmonella enterica subsp. enterica]|nr:MscS family inner membrane protein YnaI [Salmonella enterica subsp. enterica]